MFVPKFKLSKRGNTVLCLGKYVQYNDVKVNT